MSDSEALMWSLEKEPHLQSTFANVTILDQPIDEDVFKARMTRVVRQFPRLHQRVVSSFGRLAPPEWHDAPDLDLDFHIRRVALPAPGTEAQLLQLAAALARTPFDRARPLWEYVLIDGLAGGRGAMVQKMHHTITDGEGGVRMSAAYLDIERHPAPADDPGDEDVAPLPYVPRSMLDTATDLVTHNLRRQAGLARRGVEEVVGAVRHPSRVTQLPNEALATVRSLRRQVVVTGERLSPLWTERSLQRHFEVLRVPLDEVKKASRDLGGSVNDLFVTGAAGAVGAYHRDLGFPVDQLRMAMPVSTRQKGERGGNHFTPTRMLISTIEDPRRRFELVQATIGATRAERAIGLTEAVAGVVNVLPTPLVVSTALSQVQMVDFTCSNVRGAPFELFLAGAKILENYPIGPLGGTACNITTLSYDGNLDIGVHMDAAAVTEPGLLRDRLEESFEELLTLR
jgi:WS/DGAT/MGAT family acyltransferase